MRRLAIAIRSWQDCLRGVSGDSAVDTMDTTSSSSSQLPHKLGGTPALQVGGGVSSMGANMPLHHRLKRLYVQ